nr:hypothetical protein Iba_chr13dCG1660 [Ipomoea batatas]
MHIKRDTSTTVSGGGYQLEVQHVASGGKLLPVPYAGQGQQIGEGTRGGRKEQAVGSGGSGFRDDTGDRQLRLRTSRSRAAWRAHRHGNGRNGPPAVSHVFSADDIMRAFRGIYDEAASVLNDISSLLLNCMHAKFCCVFSVPGIGSEEYVRKVYDDDEWKEESLICDSRN